ncbi:MAG: IS701 family transposase [Chthoniobacterales bacterium]
MEAQFERRKEELLKECQVSVDLFAHVQPRLEKFMEPFVASFCRSEQREHACTFVQGLLSDLERKNVESIAYRFGEARLPLQWFVGYSEWDDRPLRQELVRQVGAELGDPEGVLVLDPSAFPKSGKQSVGVARQWCGRLGKIENCQVGVYLGYVSRHEHALVDRRLYLPKEWTEDKARCRKAGIPKDRRKHRTRHQLCLEMLAEHRSSLPHGWIAGDDELGRPYGFRRDLHAGNERYLLAVPSNTLIRDLEVPPPPYSGKGHPPQRPWQRVDRWVAALAASAWTTRDVRDGEKGPLIVEIVQRSVVGRASQRQAEHTEMLVVIRYRDRDQARIVKTDYYLSNAAPQTPLAEFARVAKAEHRIEECIQRSKSEAGLADYEVRNWNGWHHHQTLSLIAAWFLLTETRQGKKIHSGHHAATGPRRYRPDPASRQRLQRPIPHPTRTRNATRPQPTGALVSLEST